MHFRAGGYFPQTHGFVLTPGCQQFAVGGEANDPDDALMSFQGMPFLPCGDIPQTHGGIPTGGGQHLAVGGEVHALETRMLVWGHPGIAPRLQAAYFSPRGRAAERNVLIADGSNPFAVGGEREFRGFSG